MTSYETHTYDIFLHGTPILNQYPGYFYTGQAFCAPTFNTADYPPTSGSCVAWDTTNGFNIWVTGEQRVLTFEADFATGPPSLNPAGVVINAYNRAGVLVDQNSDCNAGELGIIVHCGVSAIDFPGEAGEIGRIQVVASAPGYWTLDTAKFGLTTEQLFDTVNVSAPSVSNSTTIPGQGIPYTSLDQTTPPVTRPATCTLDQCEEGVQVESIVIDAPPIQPIATPQVNETRIGPVRIEQINSIPLFPGYDHPPEATPEINTPAICDLPFVCLPEEEIVPGRNVNLPEVGPMPLTQAITIEVESVDLGVSATPHLLQVGTLQPISVEIGELKIHLCENGTCTGLIPPSFETSGYLRITVRAGPTEVFSQEVKPQISF